jgi:EAL domain-containing protein (putative c-di-GMP-specific phosphodiesterase class I)
MGIAFLPRDADTSEKLVSCAEAALGSARDLDLAYLFYDEDLQKRSVEKLQLLAQLRRALYEDRFELHFQPVVDTSGRIEGAECLLRWRHPEKGLLLPGKFIQIAIENGLGTEMEKQAIFSAARHLARWKDFGIYLTINLSASMFEDPSLIDYLETALKQSGGISRDLLKLEITESEGMCDADTSIRRMRELSDRGFGIYIDDFGTGHSSLRYLKDLPASVLKIDKAFVDGIESSAEDRHFLGHIIELIKDRKRSVVIEGVETAAQASILVKMEADAMQGYHFSKPLPADQFEALFRSGKNLPVRG